MGKKKQIYMRQSVSRISFQEHDVQLFLLCFFKASCQHDITYRGVSACQGRPYVGVVRFVKDAE